jgi:hypothetical protein
MPLPMPKPRKANARDLLYFTTPVLWPEWPFLPVIRHRPDGNFDCGLLYDCKGLNGRLGFSATVFLTNFFEKPSDEAAFLALPKEVFDRPEEIAAAGWVID